MKKAKKPLVQEVAQIVLDCCTERFTPSEASRKIVSIMRRRMRNADSAMLDWLSKLPRPGECLIVATGTDVITIKSEGSTLRRAIDAAMRQEKNHGK